MSILSKQPMIEETEARTIMEQILLAMDFI